MVESGSNIVPFFHPQHPVAKRSQFREHRIEVPSITPVLVDPVEGKEFDVADQLGLSSDSAIRLAPGYYGTIDLRSDASGVTLLYLAQGDVHLARFIRRPDGLERVRVEVLDRRYIGSRSIRLIDPRTVAILSADGALVIARSTQE